MKPISKINRKLFAVLELKICIFIARTLEKNANQLVKPF